MFGSIPSNIPGHRRWTSHKHRCMSHRRSLLHWSSMSRNQSRAMGLTCILRRFDALPLGSSSTGAATGVTGAARGVLTWASSSCVSGRSMASPGRHQAGRCKRTPCGSSWCSRMWSCRARSQSCCLLGRPRVCFVYLSGGQLRPTDRAMAARSARTSSSEEASRSTDDEERLLTKRSMANTSAGKTLV